MDTISERISSFTQEVLTRFADELPAETFERVSEILLRELQYQQIQEKIYVPLKNFLEEIKQSAQIQEKIVRRMDTILAGNVQQQRRDDEQMGILRSIQEEQEEVKNANKSLQENLTQSYTDIIKNFDASISSSSKATVQKIIEKIEGTTTQYNKDSTNIANQIGMLLSINRDFIQEFKNSSIDILLQESTEIICKKQTASFDKVLQQIEKMPTQIQKDVLDLLDPQKLLDVLQKQQDMISSKLTEHLDKMDANTSFEDSQILLQPIQDAVIDQRNDIDKLEEILHDIKNNIAKVASLQEKQATVVSENIQNTLAKGFPPEFLVSIEEQVQHALQGSVKKIEDTIDDGIRPKDLDILKKGISKILETSFWRIEQRLEDFSPQDKEDKVQVKEDVKSNVDQYTRILKNNLQQVELSLQDKMDTSAQSQTKHIQQAVNHYFQSQLEIYNDNIVQQILPFIKEQLEPLKNHFQQSIKEYVSPLKNDIDQMYSTVKESNSHGAFENILSENANKLEAIMERLEERLVNIDDKISQQEEYYQQLQDSVKQLENKVLALAIEKSTAKSDKVVAICPHCTKEAIGSSSMEGQRVMCRHCRNQFTFPKA